MSQRKFVIDFLIKQEIAVWKQQHSPHNEALKSFWRVTFKVNPTKMLSYCEENSIIETKKTSKGNHNLSLHPAYLDNEPEILQILSRYLT